MQLTHEGEILFAHVSRAFDELVAGEKELSYVLNYTSGKLEIGATKTALYHFLLPKIEQFRSEHLRVLYTCKRQFYP